MELGSQISTVQNDLEVTPCQKHDMPWKNNDVNDLLFSENDVREQLCSVHKLILLDIIVVLNQILSGES